MTLTLFAVGCGQLPADEALISPVCQLPFDPGICDAAIARFAYDMEDGRCEAVVYGGCGGNANNFATLEECEATCLETVACGGWAGDTCGANEVCVFDQEGCDFADASGVCAPRPELCTADYQPVCGCDGTTYSNRCHALAQGFDAAYAGVCN